MPTKAWRFCCGAALFLLLSPASRATTVPRISFEQLTDSSEIIVSGRVIQSWAAWDAEHKYIWTHYRLSVSDSAKGAPVQSVEFAEPGGVLNETALSIAGSVSYAVGDEVAVFLARMPNGYLRTTGWAQGKYSLDAGGRMHGHAQIGAETMDLKSAPAGLSLRSLEGMTFAELKQRVAARRNIR
jgi:hypothetical protein